MAAALAVFALTYLAVAAGRLPFLSLDRPAAALLGAVLMVAAGVLTPAEAERAVNGDTLGLLLGMMILSAYLGEAGFFRWASFHVLRSVAGPRTLLWALVFTAGVLSAFLVNDTVCLMMTPLVIRLVDDAELPALPYLLALAFGSNAGSVATLTGNPQNMIVGTLSGISYGRFAAALALPALASLAVVAAILHAIFRRHLPRRALAPTPGDAPAVDRRLLRKALAATALALAGFLAGFLARVDRPLRGGVAHGRRRPCAARGAPARGLAPARVLRRAVRRGGRRRQGGRGGAHARRHRAAASSPRSRWRAPSSSRTSRSSSSPRSGSRGSRSPRCCGSPRRSPRRSPGTSP